MSEPTVAATILADLARAAQRQDAPTLRSDEPASGWVCGSSFYASYRPTFAQRISELRRDGTLIESRVCQRRDHEHRGTIHEYRLASPEQRRLIA